MVALASVKASPGVTTLALALAAAWPARRRLLVEADPAGGDLGAWLGAPASPGLASLAASARHDNRRALAWHHARELAGGLHAILAPAGAEQADACLAALAGTGVWDRFLTEPAVAVADCGRLDPGSPALGIAAQASLTLLVVRPQVSELSHLALRITGLINAGLRLGLLLAPAGHRTPAGPAYRAQEITATLHLPVHASIPCDPRAAAALIEHRGALPSAKAPLAQAAATLAAALDADSRPPQLPGLPARRRSGGAAGEVTVGEQAL